MSQSLYNQALTQYQNNQLPEAIQSLKTLLKNNPHDADSLHLLGVMYYQTNQGALAIQSIEQAVAIAPKNADYLNNFGLILKANGKLDDALKAYQNAILINPKDLDIQLNIANLMMETARFEEAAGYYRRLLRVYKPYQAEHGPIRDALCHALSNLGNAASKNGNHIQAEACFAEAVQFNSQDNAYLYNLGNVQRELGEIDKAINSYEKALSIDPDLHHAKVHLVHQKQHTCDWKGLDAAIESIEMLVNTVPTAQVSPFAFLAMPGTSRAAQLKCANQWISNRFQGLIKANIDFAQNKKRNKITIGYLSADFRLHPLAFLISDLLECHDRNTFEVIAYSFGANDQSAERKRLAKSVDEFHDIATLSEIDAAQKIHADGVDILVDLTGFTQTSRSGIMALRPARVHVSWLGFAGTMGYLDITQQTPLFDYLLTDETITPPAHAQDYAEKLAYLPCYQPNDRQRPIGETPTRASCQLPDNAFVFCSFNQSFKITPDVFAAWLRILKATPNSVLWLLDCNPLAKTNLLATAQENGIDTARIIFAPRVAIKDHLARHTHADLFLDTLTYNAHTTCSDALWMDLPVLTVQGDTFSSRVASSLLKTVGLDRMIVDSIAAYEKVAVSLASDAAQLADVKNTLKANKMNAVLFDTPAFTQALESCFKGMLDAD